MLKSAGQLVFHKNTQTKTRGKISISFLSVWNFSHDALLSITTAARRRNVISDLVFRECVLAVASVAFGWFRV